MKTKCKTQNCYIQEVDNFDYMKKSPIIFFRYTIQMVMFLVSIYLVHLNFSIMNALWALILLIVSEAVLEMIENSKYSNITKKISLFKCITNYLDRNFHFVILIVSFAFRIFWYFKLNIEYEGIEKYISIFNILCGCFISLFIYLISKELFSKKTGQILSIFYSIGIATSTYCVVITNYHLFAVLILFAVYLSISKKYMYMNNMIKNIVIGLLLGIASIIRIEAVIYVISFIIYLFANSLIKNNIRREKYFAIILILITYLSINIITIGIVKIFDLNNGLNIKEYIGIFDKEKSVEKFELNQKEYWSNTDYKYLDNSIKINKINKFDSAILLFVFINAAILVIYCKVKNIEDERMYLIYIVVLANFFVFGFVNNNNIYSYVAKIMLYILAAGGLTIFKKNAELEAREKYGIKLLTD